MYYPYLRGKQFELKALREISHEDPNNHYICPIIEPVKSNLTTLMNAIKDMKTGNLNFFLIVNPSDGDFKFTQVNLLEDLQEELDGSLWSPALLYNRNCGELNQLITSKGLNNVCVIFRNGIDLEQDPKLDVLLSSKSISSVVIANADVRASKSALCKFDKHIIRLDDNFKAQKSNYDYANIPEEQFSEEPFYYNHDAFYGFADYTTLSKTYSEGGVVPYAVAIHLTYYRPSPPMVYIRHFVSDLHGDNSNIRKKFEQAGRKAIQFFEEHHDLFRGSAIEELNNYIEQGKYPGLGVIKKISIKHHLQLISDILSNLNRS